MHKKSKFSSVLLSVVGAAGLSVGMAAQAEEVMGKVLSTTPVTVQVPVQTQVCGVTPVAVQTPPSGGGAVLGAIAGGAIGNALGGGAGKALATAAGVVGGAMVGNSIEASGNTQVVNAQQCGWQTAYQNRTVFNVVYEYADKQYTVQMPVDPGPTIRLQLGPVQAPPPEAMVGQPGAPVVGQPPVMVVAPPYYPYPGYYPGYYPYFPVGVSVGVGFGHYWGGGRHWH
jgi:uncharacterized protein YcfJ